MTTPIKVPGKNRRDQRRSILAEERKKVRSVMLPSLEKLVPLCALVLLQEQPMKEEI